MTNAHIAAAAGVLLLAAMIGLLPAHARRRALIAWFAAPLLLAAIVFRQATATLPSLSAMLDQGSFAVSLLLSIGLPSWLAATLGGWAAGLLVRRSVAQVRARSAPAS